MTTSEFNYQLYPLGETEKYRPMIKTRIGYNGALSGFQAIVDSGSDWTILNIQLLRHTFFKKAKEVLP